MKHTMIVTLALAATAASAIEFETPEIGADIIMEYLHFSGDSTYSDQGYYTADQNRYRIRKVAIHIEGRAGDYISYFGEAGIASCGGGSNISVKDAGIFVDPLDLPFRIGIGQLHAARGFSMLEECGAMLLLEKPRWAKTLAPSCHALGSITEFEVGLGSAGSFSSQLGYFNGSSSTVEADWDFVGWLQYHTPVEGLSLGGFYEKLHIEMDPEVEGYEEAERFGVGVDMSNGALEARAEYISMTGIPIASKIFGIESGCADIENTGLLFQAGYTIDPDLTWVTGVRPYAGYQIWDRWSNADEGDWRFSWLEAGVQVNVETDSWITIGWRGPAGTPDDQPEDSSVLVVRMGTEI